MLSSLKMAVPDSATIKRTRAIRLAIVARGMRYLPPFPVRLLVEAELNIPSIGDGRRRARARDRRREPDARRRARDHYLVKERERDADFPRLRRGRECQRLIDAAKCGGVGRCSPIGRKVE